MPERLYKVIIGIVVFNVMQLNAFNVDTLFICKNSCIIYSNQTTQGNAIAWEWNFQGGSISTSNQQNPPQVCYTSAGVFKTTVKTTFDNSTDTTDEVFVKVIDHPIPAFKFPSDTGYCQGGGFSIALNTTLFANLAYQWSTGETTSGISVNTPGKYWVNLVIKAGGLTCDSVYREVNVTEYPKPSVYLGQDKYMCQNQVITLDAGVGANLNYSWKPNGETTRFLNAILPGLYSVTVTNSFGCSGSDEIELKDSCPHYIFIPNAVSPNDDRLNDKFIKVWNFTPKDFQIRIFNRWGELLFESNDMNAAWDCKVNDELVEQDIYFYIISYFDTDKKWYEFDGTFFVVR